MERMERLGPKGAAGGQTRAGGGRRRAQKGPTTKTKCRANRQKEKAGSKAMLGAEGAVALGRKRGVPMGRG